MWKHWGEGKAGYLGNNIGTTRVGKFGYRIGETSVYPKFVHL